MVYDNLSAMQSFAAGTATIAHNIANITTPQYTQQNFTYGAGPTGNVEIQYAISDDVEIATMSTQAPIDPAPTFVPSELTTYTQYHNEIDITENTVSLVEQSAYLIMAQRGFEANAATIALRAAMETDSLGLVANIHV